MVSNKDKLGESRVLGRHCRLQRTAVREGRLGRWHKLVPCRWVWSGPYNILEKFKIETKIENQDVSH